MATVDVLFQDLSVELLGFGVVTGEALLGVRNEETTVGSALHGTEHSRAGRSALETDIKVDLEGTGAVLERLCELHLALGLSNTLVLVVEADLLEDTTGSEETGGVSSSPVGETVLDAVARKLVGIGSAKGVIALDLGRDNLDNDVLVGEADHQAVLGAVVLVLGLVNHTLTGLVVGLALCSSQAGQSMLSVRLSCQQARSAGVEERGTLGKREDQIGVKDYILFLSRHDEVPSELCQ